MLAACLVCPGPNHMSNVIRSPIRHAANIDKSEHITTWHLQAAQPTHMDVARRASAQPTKHKDHIRALQTVKFTSYCVQRTSARYQERCNACQRRRYPISFTAEEFETEHARRCQYCTGRQCCKRNKVKRKTVYIHIQ